MQRVYLSLEYPDQFIYEYIPKVFTDIVIYQLKQNEKSAMHTYIKEHYNLNFSDINKYLDKLRIDRYAFGYVIHCDISDKTANGYYLREIFHVISYGNLEIKGLHIIDGALDYIRKNANVLYRLYLFNCSRFNNRKIKKKGLNDGDTLL